MTRVRLNVYICRLAMALLVCEVLFSPAIYWAFLNNLGPSTEYYDPTIQGATQVGDDEYVAYVGDKIFVTYIVIRHKINGTCQLHVSRYGEAVGGPNSGKRYLLDVVNLQFVGRDRLHRPRWPLDGLTLKDKLIPDGAAEQRYAVYVVARYHCNFMDDIFPRYLQGGIKPNETERVYLTVKRNRP